MANNAKISRLFGANTKVVQIGADESGNRDQRQGRVTQMLPPSGASSAPPGSSNNIGNCSSSAPVRLFDINIEVKVGDESYNPDTPSTVVNNTVVDEKKRRLVKKKREEDQRPIEEIPAELLQAVEELNGTRPVFLYGKKLEESRKNQNRLFVIDRKKFIDFWRLEVLEDGVEVEVEDVDANNNTSVWGCLKELWGSLKQLVVKREGAEKGDWVQVWGFRVDGISCLAINFVKP